MINLFESGRLLYISSVDISIGNGPGVNEVEFLNGLLSIMGNRAHFLIPRPNSPVSEIAAEQCTYSQPHHQHSPWHFHQHIISQIKQANRLISQEHFDLLLFRLDLLPFAPLYITKKHNIPYALKTLGQGLMNIFSDKITWPIGSLLSTFNQTLVKKLVKGAIAVDTVSQIQKTILDNSLNVEDDRITYIDNAVNTKRFYPIPTQQAKKELGLDKYNPIIGYAGNNAHTRGGIQLIEAAPALLQKYPNLGVVILGDTKGSQSLIDSARNLNIENHCVFTGNVPFNQVPAYINAFDVGTSLLPQKHHGQSELKVRQYLACGKPVVATTPGSNDFIAENDLGTLIQNGDKNSTIDALDKWISTSDEERSQFSARAHQFARDHLSIEQMLDKRITLWNERMNLNNNKKP
jgi:glycosyltransferase involved in cell wall biosynthesis